MLKFRRLWPLLAMLAACLLALAGCGATEHGKPAFRRLATTATTTAAPVALPPPVCPGWITAYGCQAHSPTFGLPPRNAPHLAHQVVPTLEQFDTVTVNTIPVGAKAVAGYISGFWPTFVPLKLAFPLALHVPIAIRALPVYPSLFGKLACLDIEPGDAQPQEAGPWAHGEIGLGVVPCVYSDLSELPAVLASLRTWHVPRSQYLIWDADWTFVPGLDVGADCTQWTDHALNRNLDESTCALSFYAALRPPPPPPPPPPRRASAEIQLPPGTLTGRCVATATRGHWTSRGCRVRSEPYNSPPLLGGR